MWEKPPGGEVPTWFRLLVAGLWLCLLLYWFG